MATALSLDSFMEALSTVDCGGVMQALCSHAYKSNDSYRLIH